MTDPVQTPAAPQTEQPSQNTPPPAPTPAPAAAPAGPTVEELQNQLKERDTKIADLETTVQTIQQRQQQVQSNLSKSGGTDEQKKQMRQRMRSIMEKSQVDPEGAAEEMANLMEESSNLTVQQASQLAASNITQQQVIGKLRAGVKSANPEFDDDIVDTVMIKADEFAASGKYKTAEEAVKAASDFVRSKFEAFAKSRTATPTVPAGARAESGAPSAPPAPPPAPAPETPLQEIEARKQGLQSKIL